VSGMTVSDHVFRIHPAIGFARVGNSEAYYLALGTARSGS
jgi:hypothetical protein